MTTSIQAIDLGNYKSVGCSDGLQRGEGAGCQMHCPGKRDVWACQHLGFIVDKAQQRRPR